MTTVDWDNVTERTVDPPHENEDLLHIYSLMNPDTAICGMPSKGIFNHICGPVMYNGGDHCPQCGRKICSHCICIQLMHWS